MNFHLDASPITFTTQLRTHRFIHPSNIGRQEHSCSDELYTCLLDLFHKYPSKINSRPPHTHTLNHHFSPYWGSLGVTENVENVPLVALPALLFLAFISHFYDPSELPMPGKAVCTSLRPHSWIPALTPLRPQPTVSGSTCTAQTSPHQPMPLGLQLPSQPLPWLIFHDQERHSPLIRGYLHLYWDRGSQMGRKPCFSPFFFFTLDIINHSLLWFIPSFCVASGNDLFQGRAFKFFQLLYY